MAEILVCKAACNWPQFANVYRQNFCNFLHNFGRKLSPTIKCCKQDYQNFISNNFRQNFVKEHRLSRPYSSILLLDLTAIEASRVAQMFIALLPADLKGHCPLVYDSNRSLFEGPQLRQFCPQDVSVKKGAKGNIRYHHCFANPQLMGCEICKLKTGLKKVQQADSLTFDRRPLYTRTPLIKVQRSVYSH